VYVHVHVNVIEMRRMIRWRGKKIGMSSWISKVLGS